MRRIKTYRVTCHILRRGVTVTKYVTVESTSSSRSPIRKAALRKLNLTSCEALQSIDWQRMK